jgi:hypothetical protein
MEARLDELHCEVAMMDWLIWPADLLLKAGAAVASLFVSEDAPSFIVIQMMIATLVLAAIVSVLVFWQSFVEFWRARSPTQP